MAVAFDAATESHTGTAASVSETSFTFQHNPVGTPRGILVFTFVAGSATEQVTGVTYDGEALTAVSGGSAADTSTEPGRCTAWFKGSGINTTDPADVVVSRTSNTNAVYAVCYSVTAVADTEVYEAGVVLLQENGTLTVQSVDDGSPGTDSVRFAGVQYGGTAGLTAGVGSTLDHAIVYDNDPNSTQAGAVHETTAGQGARDVGFAMASDDRAAVHLAIREVVAPAVLPILVMARYRP